MLQLIHSFRKKWFPHHFLSSVSFLKDCLLMLHKYKAGQSGFSLGEPLPCLCRWKLWIVLSTRSWKHLCSFKDSCLTCIDPSFKAHFLISCAWYPGAHMPDKVEFPDHTFCSHLKIYSLAPPPGFWSMEKQTYRNHWASRGDQKYSS